MSDRRLYKYTVELYDLWLMLNWKVPWKKAFGTYTKFYPGVYLEELKK